MVRRPRFKPTITRVKLNPEQAVLACQCYNGTGWMQAAAWQGMTGMGGCHGKSLPAEVICTGGSGIPAAYTWHEGAAIS